MQNLIYETLILFCILLFAVYDIHTKRVSNKALAFFCPVALLAPFIRVWGNRELSLSIVAFVASALGAAAAFCTLLVAAMLSKGGSGIGGGDIKLAAVMGFVYGPSRICFLLLIASFLAAIAAGILRAYKKEGQLSLPYVPFLALGSAVVTAIQLIN